MDFDRPWLKHGLLSEGGCRFLGTKNHILLDALALPNKRDMIQRYCSCAFLMLECTFLRTNGISQLFKHSVPDC